MSKVLTDQQVSAVADAIWRAFRGCDIDCAFDVAVEGLRAAGFRIEGDET